MNHHFHPHERELTGLLVPADKRKKIKLVTVKNNWEAMTKAIGADYMERVRTSYMPELYCGCTLSMIVDETGVLKNLPPNERATLYYPNGPFGIRGDVILFAEGPVQQPDDSWPEPDFFSLPDYLADWKGPGHDLPKPKVD